MSNFFENLKSLLFKSLLKKKDYDTEKDNNFSNNKKQLLKTQQEKDCDENSILLEEEHNNRLQNENYFNKRKLLSKSLLQNRLIPILYLTFAFSSLLFLMQSEINYGKNSENYISIDKKTNKELFNFFMLYNLNPLVFHLFSITNGLLGILIVYLVQNTIYLKSLNFYNSLPKFTLIKIYLTSFFGLFSNLVHIVAGMVFFFSNFGAFNNYVVKELNLTLHQFLFCIEIFFTVLYGIFACLILNKLNKIDVLESDSEQEKYNSESFNYGRNNSTLFNGHNQISAQIIPDNLDGKWLNYKIICVVYLAFFSVCYSLLLLIKHNKINLMDKDTAYFKMNETYLVIFLPYLLYTLNSVFYSLFYGVLKYSSTCHIEFTSQNVYDKSQKNML